jgi:hypothetical protein
MLGLKSLEQKLRDGNGRTAPATVLEIEQGKSLNFTNDTGPASHGSGNTVETTVALSKDKYRITVKPEGEPEFEAIVKVSDRDFSPPQYPFRPRTALIVLFDPSDHQRVTIDVAATWAKWEALTQKKAQEQATESALAAAQTAQATPDVTEQLTRLGDLRPRGPHRTRVRSGEGQNSSRRANELSARRQSTRQQPPRIRLVAMFRNTAHRVKATPTSAGCSISSTISHPREQRASFSPTGRCR